MPASGTGVDLFGVLPGRLNALADVPGLGVGHARAFGPDGRQLSTGVTVVASPGGAVAAVDVRGGGPGTRETDLLVPSNTVQQVHAVALCGGSAFGLEAATGVAAGLEAAGIGFSVPGFGSEIIVPIVPAAVIFDLAVGDAHDRPDAACGRAALSAALHNSEGHPGLTQIPANGSIGAGTAASAGAIKGGFGQASAVIGAAAPDAGIPGSGRTVAVGLVANPVGSAIDPDTGWPWGLGAQLAGEFDCYWDDDHDAGSNAEGVPGDFPDPAKGGRERILARGLGGTKIPAPGDTVPGLNTTIGVVATDAPVTKAQAERLAMAAHDGLARAVRPSHLPMDGDAFFALGVSKNSVDTADGGVSPDELAVLCATAADCVERAIVHAILAADGAFGVPSWRELMR